MAGITTRVSRVDEIIPPIMGTAMRCMTSEPVPALHMIGSSPAIIAITVIILGRTRSTVHILQMNGDSYRLNQSKRRSRRSSSDTSADHPTQD